MDFKVGIVGLGGAARKIHLPALRKIPGVRVVGGYDPETSATSLGIAQFESLDQLLAESDPDMLVVSTPPGSHAEISRRALLAGCHVFCEKPFVDTLQQADQIAALSRAQRRTVIVNSQFPFMPIHSEAKKVIGTADFGELKFLSINQTFVTTDETESSWRGSDPRRVVRDFGTHVIDLAKFFFDARPVSMRCMLPGFGIQSGADNLCIIMLEFPGHRYAHILLDRLTKGRHRYLDVRLDGEHAVVETSLGGSLRVSIGLRPQGRRPFIDVDMAGGGHARLYKGETHHTLARAPLDVFADATAKLLQSALPSLRKDDGSGPPDEAVHTLRLLLACYERCDGELIDCSSW